MTTVTIIDETNSDALDSNIALRPICNTVLDTLSAVDGDAVQGKLLGELMAIYDPELASRYSTNQLSTADTENIQLIRELVKVESEAYDTFSHALANALLEGEIGAGFKKKRMDEWKYVKDAHWVTPKMILTSSLLGAATGAVSGYNPALSAQLGVQSAATSAQQMAAMSQSFFDPQAAVTQKAYEVTVSLNNKQTKMTYSSLAELRKELSALYQEQKLGPAPRHEKVSSASECNSRLHSFGC